VRWWGDIWELGFEKRNCEKNKKKKQTHRNKKD